MGEPVSVVQPGTNEKSMASCEKTFETGNFEGSCSHDWGGPLRSLYLLVKYS
jgi:hypothetical protein